jgi:hypothetical protein
MIEYVDLLNLQKTLAYSRIAANDTDDYETQWHTIERVTTMPNGGGTMKEMDGRCILVKRLGLYVLC